MEHLKKRSEILQSIRRFFLDRGLFEVETPLLAKTTVTDPFIESFQCEENYLQTSPEFYMKRLLAAGSGSIFQICKSFRKEQKGRYHNPEFTMLEWYRVGFDHYQLMDETENLLHTVLKTTSATRITYRDVLKQYLNLDPFRADLSTIQACAKQHGLSEVSGMQNASQTSWLDLLFSHLVQPHLGLENPTFIYHYPVEQAALAKIKRSDPPYAERFEVYFKGLELANGFHELTDADEQRKRFMENINTRKKNGQPTIECDQIFLEALPHLPPCAGIALGIDRLVMRVLELDRIAEVISFT